MNAIGAYGGNMISLGFDVVTPAPPTTTGANLNGYTIRIGTTTATSLTTWLPTSTVLFTVPSLVTTVGWNTHTFNSPYFWDGVSNLVIETCFDNYAGTYDTPTMPLCGRPPRPFLPALTTARKGEVYAPIPLFQRPSHSVPICS